MAVKDKEDGFPEELTVSLDVRSFLLDMAMDLKLVVAFMLATIALIYVPYLNDSIVRTAFGVVLVLLVPGYAMIAAFFPKKADLGGIERVALSFGLSVAITALTGFGLIYTPWGVRLDSVVVCLTIFTGFFVLAANKRRHIIPAEDQFQVDFGKIFADLRKEAFPASENRIDKILSVILVISILVSICTIAYVVVVPKQGEKYTEFYILDVNGKADHYPTLYFLGEEYPVVVGITNHEYRNVTYDLVVVLKDNSSTTQLYADRLILGNNQTLEKTVHLKPDHKGNKMMMEFDLYADGNMTAPYREVHLWVDVI